MVEIAKLAGLVAHSWFRLEIFFWSLIGSLVDLKKQTLECVGCGKQVNLKDLTEKEREVISLKCAIAKDIESILSK